MPLFPPPISFSFFPASDPHLGAACRAGAAQLGERPQAIRRVGVRDRTCPSHVESRTFVYTKEQKSHAGQDDTEDRVETYSSHLSSSCTLGGGRGGREVERQRAPHHGTGLFVAHLNLRLVRRVSARVASLRRLTVSASCTPAPAKKN